MFKLKVVTGLLAAVGLFITYSCVSSDQAPTETRRQRIPEYTSLVGLGLFSNTTEGAERLRDVEANIAWISQVQREGIREAHAERLSWSKQERQDPARICAQAMRLGLKYASKANLAAGLPAGTDQDNLPAVQRALRMAKKCGSQVTEVRSMSIFARLTRASMTNTVVRATRFSEPQATVDALAGAFGSSGTNGSDIAQAMEPIMTTAEGSLSAPDFEIAVAEASISINTLLEWQALSESGNWAGSGGGGGGEGEMSIFKAQYVYFGVFWAIVFHPRAKAVSLAGVACAAGAFSGGVQAMIAAALICAIAAY